MSIRLLYCPVIALLLSSLLLFVAGAHSAGPTLAHDVDPETTLSPGLYQLTVEIDYSVVDPDAGNAPQIAFTNLADHAEISAPTPVAIRVEDDDLDAREADVPAELLASGATAVDGQIVTTLDPTLRVNGLVRRCSRPKIAPVATARSDVTLYITGEMKVGHLHFAVEALNVPVAGVPIRLLRSYDSRRREAKWSARSC